MTNLTTFCLALAVLSLGDLARATTFGPYCEERYTDAGGRYYVVVRRREKHKEAHQFGPVTLTIAERRPGSPPVQYAQVWPTKVGDFYVPTQNPAVCVQAGDIVHARIDRDLPPRKILVSTSGKGIVTFDSWPFNDFGPSSEENDLVIYSLKGEVLHRISRSELFDEATRERFPHMNSCPTLLWLRRCWLDEKRDEIVVVGISPRDEAGPPPMLTVGFTSGTVRKAGSEVIDRAITERNPGGLWSAIDLAEERKLTGSKAAWPGILEDETLSLRIRLQAAVLLASVGDRRGARLLSTTALLGAGERAAGHPDAEHASQLGYAIEHLPDLLDDEALPMLGTTLVKAGHFLGHDHAFKKLGRKSVPTLVSILDDDRAFDAQLDAASCLGSLGPEAEEAVPALIRALHKPRGKKQGVIFVRLDSCAAWALEHIGPKAKAAIPHLEQLAKADDKEVRDSAQRALDAIRGKTSKD